MNYRQIFNVIGKILCVEAIFMLPALLISALCDERSAVIGFAATIVLTGAAGIAMSVFLKPSRKGLFVRDGFMTVGLAWVIVSLFGSLPFYISGAVPSYMDCLFETISGFTTTGATVIDDVEALPRGILYWRSFTHWLGGMGVLVFILAIGTRTKNSDSIFVLRAESTGPSVTKLVPRMQRSASILYKIYIGLSLLQLCFLLAGKMPLFDAVTTTFSTAGTGGFAILNDSMASYSPYLQTVTAVFMIVFGVNISLYYFVIIRDFVTVFKSEELRNYLGILAIAIAIVTINILPIFNNVGQSLHHAFFQVASFMTSTGFSTVSFVSWPLTSVISMVFLMIIGSMAGSTGGGLKVARVSLIMKEIRRSISKVLHPNSVKLIHMDGEVVDERVVDEVKGYVIIFAAIILVSMFFLAFDSAVDFTANVTVVLSALGNVGPCFGSLGAASSLGQLSVLSKIVLCFDMLLGRLEIFPILILFAPSTWKK